ncbi:YitT family protein [Mycoplasma sp. Mirounga ES2805-ORL]|uniref:YitT family protein n=1 Tax=Mycoplasma sp. Mirounga ES2805-ORL TaxID=754514 RepID=UPI00197C3D4A|nr:YitT family protein [Mycoplasma sp. Mirounga ES2805-ORL]QSF13910.1 YitT family protein [Mycoplasma sp. Mirounga ES2805-ORL]
MEKTFLEKENKYAIEEKKLIVTKLEEINNADEADNDEDLDVKNLELFIYKSDKNVQNKKDINRRKRFIKDISIKLTYMFIAAIIFNFGVIAFLNKANTVPSGISGIAVLAIILHPNVEPWFAAIYLATNIPLFLIFSWRSKKSFTFLTIAFMLFQIITNLFFTTIPAVENFIKERINISPGWNSILEFKDPVTHVITKYENPDQWPIFLNGLIGSVFLGFAISIAWKHGGSTGGTDIIAYYFSTKKQKNISSILYIISFLTTITFLLIFAFVKPHAPHLATNSIEMIGGVKHEVVTVKPGVIFGLREYTSLQYIFIVNIMIHFIYPKYKKVAVEIWTANPKKTIKFLKVIEYWHAYSIHTAESGYTGKPVYKIETTMLLFETKPFIKDLRRLDPTLWINVKKVHSIIGQFNTKFVDE